MSVHTNVDQMLRYHQEFLSQQKQHQESQKDTLKLVNILNKTVSIVQEPMHNIIFLRHGPRYFR